MLKALFEGVNAKTLVIVTLGLAGWHYADVGEVKDLRGDLKSIRQQNADQEVRITAPLAVAATQVSAQSWLDKFKAGFLSVMDAVKKYSVLALDFIIRYTPQINKIADAILPGYAAMSDTVAATIEAVAGLLRNAILAAEKAYADASAYTKGTKLADVLAALTSPVLALLKVCGINVDSGWLLNAINAVVGLLKLTPVDSAEFASAAAARA